MRLFKVGLKIKAEGRTTLIESLPHLDVHSVNFKLG